MKSIIRFIKENQEDIKKYSNIIVLNKNEDKVLILRKSRNDKRFKNMWRFTSEYIEKTDKNGKEACIRELKEETGIELSWNESFKCKKYDIIENPDGSISEYYLVVLEKNPEEITIKLSQEHSAFEWFDENCIKKYRWLDSVFQIIQKVI